jgi:hypothetical protein
MNISGRVENGVIIPDGNQPLPEGALVCISLLTASPGGNAGKHRVQLPLVAGAQPGKVNLTNLEIAEIMDDEDAAPRH